MLSIIAVGLRVWAAVTSFRSVPAKTVLVFEPFGMGDVLSLEPLIGHLANHGFEVRLGARPEWRELYPKEGIARWLAPQIPWTSYASKGKYPITRSFLRDFWTCVCQLRLAGKGTVGLDPRGDVRSVILLYLAGCYPVATLECYLGSDIRIPRAAARIIECPENFRRWEINLLFSKALSISPPKNPRPPSCSHLRNGRKKTRTAGLIPIAPWRGKWWNSRSWIELRKRLTADKWHPVGLCGPGQLQFAQLELGEEIELHECLSVQEWSLHLQLCSFVITLDSGPMHLADALGVPVVALFGQGKLPLWAPSGEHSKVVSHQDDRDFALCHPTEENTNLGAKFMDRITVEEVMSAVERVRARIDVAEQFHAREKTRPGA